MFSDFISFLRRGDDSGEIRKEFVCAAPTKLDAGDVERCFARLFSTADGQKVLSHLQAVTFQRALGPATTDQQLRHAEGQRALVATILRLIDKGRGR